MGEIVLSPGDKQKVVSQPGRGEAYNINVENADVYLNHSPNGIVREGKLVNAGDRAQANNLQGGSLWAKNPSSNDKDARINVDKAGFALNFMTRSVVERPSDRAAREETADSGSTSQTIGASSSGFIDAYNNDTGGVMFLEMATLRFSDAASMSDSRPEWNIIANVAVRDASNNVVYNVSMNAGQFPLNPSQALPIPDGGVVRAAVNNNTTNSREIVFGAIVRP
jgi:hypothetical protein